MKEVNIIMERLDSILLEQSKNSYISKDILSCKQASMYLDIAISQLYKLTHANLIPFYKPNGKKIYFKRTDLDDFMLQNRHSSIYELEEQANKYLVNEKIKRS